VFRLDEKVGANKYYGLFQVWVYAHIAFKEQINNKGRFSLSGLYFCGDDDFTYGQTTNP
jgi:hypothetical protein